MNERINKLLAKAGAYFGGEGVDYSNFDPNKFAELIVRECADIAREIGNNTEPDDFALDRCYEIEDQIMKHFGVKQ